MANNISSLVLFVAPIALLAASNSAPESQPFVDTIPAARDVPWPGTIRLSVDATDVTRGIFQVTETIPVSGAGALTVLYPEWLPGYHSAMGVIRNLAGLKFSSGGTTIAWQRDAEDMFAFHVDVPPGANELRAEFQFLAPTGGGQGRIVTTPDLMDLQWTAVALYPAGYYVRRIPVEASLTLPDGWKIGTALEIAGQDGATIHFQRVSFDTLMDSPVFSGANVRVETLAPGVKLDIVADRPEQLAATDGQIQFFRNLVTQAVKLFGSQHYDHYDFLLALSDRVGRIGLEHHRSSENVTKGDFFTDWASLNAHDLLSHEYTHSWNGKFRRPADLWTPDYRTPMRDSLLWVYEGQTQFWGFVLGARAGLLSQQDTLDVLALVAASLDNQGGRTWRPLADTTEDPLVAARRPKGWASWQRGEDYYNEGMLIWLDADSLIREKSGGTRSLDDFARAFFGINDRDWGEVTYTFDDVVAALNSVQPYDWATFLHDRLDKTTPHPPLDGLTRGGYRLVYTDSPSGFFRSIEKLGQFTNLSFSGGLALGKDGTIVGVLWDSPAFEAGLTVGTKLIAVNERAYDVDDLKATIKAKKSPIRLLVRTGDIFRTVALKYDGGLRYPKLEKTGTGPSSLDALLAPKP